MLPCNLQQSVTHGLRRGINRWFLISRLFSTFHIRLSVIGLHQFGISDGLLCLSCGIYTWSWLLSNSESFGACNYHTKPVSMHMEPKRVYTPHWTNISITWRPCHLQQPVYNWEGNFIYDKDNLTKQTHMLQIYTKSEKRIETIETNTNVLWIFWRHKVRNTLLLASSIVYRHFMEACHRHQFCIAMAQFDRKHFLRRTISTQRTIWSIKLTRIPTFLSLTSVSKDHSILTIPGVSSNFDGFSWYWCFRCSSKTKRY